MPAFGKQHTGTAFNAAWTGLLQQYADDRAQGNVTYVHATNGANLTNYGGTPETPLAAISQALALCASDNDDLILALPGSAETMVAAGTLTVSAKTGVTIRGVGRGRQRPRFNYATAAAASLDITAARTVIENFYFTATGVAAVAAAVNVQAADVVIRDCEFELADSSNKAVLGVLTTAAANRLLIERCYFHGTADAGTTAAIRLVGGSDITIRDCLFVGAYGSGVGAIENLTTATARAFILGNVIQNLTAGCTKAMVFDVGATGQIANNRLQILSGTAPITGAAMSWAGGNYYAAALATAGTLI